MRGISAIKSRASTKSRFRLSQLPAVVGVPPLFTEDPEFYQGFWQDNMFQWSGNIYVSAPNVALQAYLGIWDDTAGTTTVTGAFYDEFDNLLASTPITIEGSLLGRELELTSGNIGQYLRFVTTATRGGVTVTRTTMQTIYVLASAPAPAVWYNAPGFVWPPPVKRVNASITKPTLTWTAGASITPITTSGEWYRNGVATGVTGATFPDAGATNPLGQATAEGDRIHWLEVCVNDAEVSGTSEVQNSTTTLVSNSVDDAVIAMRNGIDTRIDGLAGGSLNMKRFTTKNHATQTYVWNPDVWCYDIRDQLSAVAVWKSGMTSDRPEDYGGVLITPRHVLYCRHAHPHAANTWMANDARQCDVRFVLADGTVVNAVQLHQANSTVTDLCVAVLDQNVSALGVHVMPITPFDDFHWNKLHEHGAPSLPVFAISQGYNDWRPPDTGGPVAAYNYPDHDVLCYIVDLHNMKRWANPANPPIDTYLDFNFAVYDGDSGTGAFQLYDDTVYLFQITTVSWGGVLVGGWIDDINTMIAQADADAIALGRMTTPTGYTVNRASQPTFGMEPITTAAGEPITLVDDFVLTRTI